MLVFPNVFLVGGLRILQRVSVVASTIVTHVFGLQSIYTSQGRSTTAWKFWNVFRFTMLEQITVSIVDFAQ